MADTEKWPEFLKSFPCLWNPQDPDFLNEVVKEACRGHLLEICNVQSSVPVDMKSLKQWLSANIVTPEFHGVTRPVQSSQYNQTLEESGVQQNNNIPDLKDLVLEYPCLWNQRDPNYKNYSMRERCKRQLLAKCNSLSSTVITMCTLRRELASLCSRMRRRKNNTRVTKEKRSSVALQSVPVTAPAPLASSDLPQQIISPRGPELPQQIISPLRSELPQQIISPLRSELPQQIISPLKSELPQQIVSPPESELPQQIISPLRSELPQQIISPLRSELPQQIIGPLWSELPQQIISPLRSDLPQQIISPPGSELPLQIISPPQLVIGVLWSQPPQQIINPGTELPQQIISSPGKEFPQQIISPPVSKLPQQNIISPGTQLPQIISPPGIGLSQEIIDLTSGRGLPQPIIRPPGTELQQIISPPSALTSGPTHCIPNPTEIPPFVNAEPENDQNLPKKADNKKPKSKERKKPTSNEKERQLEKPTLSTLAKEFPCLWHPDHPHYGFGAVRNLSLQLLLVKYNDIFPEEKLTLRQLRRKMKNRAQTMFNNKTKNPTPKDQQSYKQNTEKCSQPPSDNMALLDISSDSDGSLSNYKHDEAQNQKTTVITPTTEVTNPTTEITVPNTETTVPDTEILVPDTEILVPDTEISVPDTEVTVTDMGITMPVTEITPATKTLLLKPETAESENDQNLLKEIEKNKTKGQKSQSAPKKGEKETQQPTLANLIEEFPCLWDPEHPYSGFGTVKTLSLQLLLAKYNDVYPEKITLRQLGKKMRNLSMCELKNRKTHARKAVKPVTQSSKKLNYPKEQKNFQTRTEETEPPNRLALFMISSDSSDSDEPLSKYRQPRNQEITAPNMEIDVPNTEITMTNTEITVPNTEIIALNTGITVPNTGITVPNMGITVPNIGITVPNTGITVPNSGITVPNIGITVPNSGITVPNMGITVPNTGITVSNTGITVPNSGITVPNIGITVPNIGITVPNTVITVPNTGITPDTGVSVPNTGITVPDTGITIPNAVISFNWCRFCGELKNDCTNVFHKTRTYLSKKKDCSLHVNNIWFYVGFKHETLPNTICGDCDKKLLDIYAFVKQVKDVQATFKFLENQRLKRKSESVDDTESKDGSGGKKFKITIDFNSDKLPSLFGDEDECVEINCEDKTDTIRETETDEVAKENCEVIDLNDNDIEMNPESKVRPFLSNYTELTNEVSESSKGVSNEISSQSQCVYETNDVVNCTVEANSLSVTDTELANEVVQHDSKFVVPVNVISQSPCVNGNRWVEVSPIKQNYRNVNSQSPCVDGNRWVEVSPINKNDRDVNNEESEIGDSDSSDNDSLSATNELNQPNISKVPVDISSTNTVSYKINGKDFIGMCTDKGSHTLANEVSVNGKDFIGICTDRGSRTLENKVSVQTDLNSQSPLEDDANGAVSKYRHLLLDSLSLDTEKNNVVSVGKSRLSTCNDDGLNMLNNDVETKCRLLLDSHALNAKSRKISEQNCKRGVFVNVKPLLTPPNYEVDRINDIENRHLLLDSLAVSTESAKLTEEKNNCVDSVDVKPNLSSSNNENDKNNYIESNYRHLLLDSLAVSTESAKVTEENNKSAVFDVKPHLSPSCNTDNGNNVVERKYKRLLLDSLSVDAKSAEENEQKSERIVSVQTSNGGVGSHENETDSNDTDSYEKFIKGILLQAINSADIAIKKSVETVKSNKCVGTRTIVDVKKEDDDIADKEV